MLFASKYREIFFKYPYFETIIILGAYLFIGYLFDPNDMLMLENKLSILTVVLVIITLFHGITSGLLAIFIVGFVFILGYTEFFYLKFLNQFVLVLIFGEFHYYWNRKIVRLETEGNFTRSKLGELSKAFYMLKISHDQIEESYVLKPISLRIAMGTIKGYFKEGFHKKSFESFLLLLQKNFNLENAYLAQVSHGDHIEVVAQTHAKERLDTDDLMLKNALENQTPIYVSSHDKYNHSKYLAVLPIVSHKETLGVLVIEKMPFLSFNKDNLISVLILTTYLFNELHKIQMLHNIDTISAVFDDEFRFELYRYSKMSKKHGLVSNVLIFKSVDKLKIHCLNEQIEKMKRTLQPSQHFTVPSKEMEVIVLIFPLGGSSTVAGFVDRVFEYMDFDDDGVVKYTSFNVEDIDMIHAYIGIEQ